MSYTKAIWYNFQNIPIPMLFRALLVPQADLRCQAHHSRRKGPWNVWATATCHGTTQCTFLSQTAIYCKSSGCGRPFWGVTGVNNFETSSFHPSWNSRKILSGPNLLCQSALAFSPDWMMSTMGRSWPSDTPGISMSTSGHTSDGLRKELYVCHRSCIFCIHYVYTVYLYYIYSLYVRLYSIYYVSHIWVCW